MQKKLWNYILQRKKNEKKKNTRTYKLSKLPNTYFLFAKKEIKKHKLYYNIFFLTIKNFQYCKHVKSKKKIPTISIFLSKIGRAHV